MATFALLGLKAQNMLLIFNSKDIPPEQAFLFSDLNTLKENVLLNRYWVIGAYMFTWHINVLTQHGYALLLSESSQVLQHFK